MLYDPFIDLNRTKSQWVISAEVTILLLRSEAWASRATSHKSQEHLGTPPTGRLQIQLPCEGLFMQSGEDMAESFRRGHGAQEIPADQGARETDSRSMGSLGLGGHAATVGVHNPANSASSLPKPSADPMS